MLNKPDLSPEYCLQVVISSTPSPKNWNPSTGSPSTTTLFDLGVVNSKYSMGFAQAVQHRIFPWKINISDVDSSSGTTLQQAANSVQSNAF